ncbi:MAG: thiamine-phosphate kinase [Flavobacteriales bacterium]|nr:thiamine-phosphate kinase [Flavobacteriales bacterium]
MLENSGRTELESLGEFGLIEHLTKDLKLVNKSSAVGVGDDAAVLDYKNKQTVVSTDMLVEGVHFDLTYVPLKHLGYKSVVVNLSDIAAMNAVPKQITVSIAISNRFSLEAIEEIYGGIHLACEKYKVDLVGGDTTTSNSGLIISITAIGEGDKKTLAFRGGAKKNDLICVSGDLGSAYMGLQLLEREKAVFKENPKMQPDLGGNDYILERQLKPEARTDIVQMLGEMKVQPTSMIDISDGLASELLHICHKSKVGCSVYEEKFPMDSTMINAAVSMDLNPAMCVLNGGEDYELLFTVDLSDHDKIKGNPHITIIGHVTDESEGCNMVAKGDTVMELTAQGWDAFKDNKRNEK